MHENTSRKITRRFLIGSFPITSKRDMLFLKPSKWMFYSLTPTNHESLYFLFILQQPINSLLSWISHSNISRNCNSANQVCVFEYQPYDISKKMLLFFDEVFFPNSLSFSEYFISECGCVFPISCVCVLLLVNVL